MLLRFFSLFFLLFIYCNNLNSLLLTTISSFKDEKSSRAFDELSKEGFISGTLVKTAIDYKLIESLQIGDIILGPHGLQEILYIKKIESYSYFIIKIGQNYIKTGSEQLFYLIDGSLKKAVDLQIFDQMQNRLFIDEIVQINEPCFYYLLSTKDQSFYVYPNILVHNFDPITMGAGSFFLGTIELINTVLFLTGGIYALHLYATNYFKTKVACEFEFDDKDLDLTAENLSLYNLQAIQETRSYYSSKRQELIDMYQKLIQFKNNIVGIIKPHSINSISFAHSFLSIAPIMQYQQLRLPSIEYEYKLSVAQKMQLLKLRDEELEKIQKDIFDLYFYIAFYINEIIERRDIAQKEYDQFSDDFTLVANKWNFYAPQVPYPVALENYSMHFIWQNVLDNLESKTQEVQYFLNHYQSVANNCLISQTMNLQNILIEQLAINQDIFENINDSRIRWQSNMLEVENYLKNNNWLSEQLINNLKSKVQQQRVTKEKDLLSLTKNKKHAASNAIQNNFKKQFHGQMPNIKGPDKDPDDDWFEKLKKNHERKALHYRFKKFYKDRVTKLWWSKDIDNHGGSIYKVFKEGAKGLDWVFDADRLGQKIIDKHKSPVGIFIPYKELIFY